MTVVSGVPSPWGEAAKAFFHIKGIEWSAVHLEPGNETQIEWTGDQSAPVAMYNAERPRDRWIDILLLVERLSSTPALLPGDPTDRALAIGLSHELCGEWGLGWTRRLQLIHAGFQDEGGFSKPVAKYLAAKYSYSEEIGAKAGRRVQELVSLFVSRLETQQEAGSDFYIGDALTCVDIYGAAVLALFGPLPPQDCEMRSDTRAAFETIDKATESVLDPILFAHRDMIYRKFLALPLSL